jgi:hypothetical protein
MIENFNDFSAILPSSPSFLLSLVVWGDEISNRTTPSKISPDLEDYQKHCKS